MIKRPFLILGLMLLVASIAQAQTGFASSSLNPREQVLGLINPVMGIAIAIMMLMIVLAATAYALGPVFGSESSARLKVWANNMLAAVGVCIAILLVFFFIVPATGATPVIDFNYYVSQLASIAAGTLMALIFTLLVVAAIIYALGQSMGAETRARAGAWANMAIAGSIVAAVIYVIFFQILGQFSANGFFASIPGLAPYAGPLTEVIAVIGLFILITYIAAKFFKIPEWEAYLNVEMSNLLGTFVMMVFIVGMFSFGTLLAQSLAPAGTTLTQTTITGTTTLLTPPDLVIGFMRTTVADNILRGMYDIYAIQGCTSVLNTISKRLGEAVLTQSVKVFPGIDTFVSITNVLGFGIVSIYASVQAQISLLYFVNVMVANFILPAGLILRFIPATRDAGAFLIALGFGFQVVFPTVYLISENVINTLQIEPYHSNQILIAGICGPFKYGFWGYMLNPGASPLNSIPGFSAIPGGSTVLNSLSKLVSDGYLNLISMDEFVKIMDNLASLSLIGLFMPAISMLFTIASINVMTKFILMKT